MADPVLPGGIRVLSILQGTSGLPEDRYINTWAFSSDVAETEAGQLAAIAKVGNFFQNIQSNGASVMELITAQTIDETACELRAYWMGQPPPRDPVIVAWSGLTFGASAPLPSEVALCASFYAGSNRPRNRGRVFIGPLASAISTTGAGRGAHPSTVARATLALASEQLAEDVTGPRWCVLGTATAGPAKELKVVTGGWVDDAFDTQRRRGEGAQNRTNWEI